MKKEQEMLQDPETGEYFIPTHGNQKYVTPQNRIDFNNDKAKKKREKKKKVQSALDLNHKVLENELKDEEKVRRHEQFLLGRRYCFTAYTGAYLNNETKQNVCQVFNICITKTGDKHYEIFRVNPA
jgi:hypothetical protein